MNVRNSQVVERDARVLQFPKANIVDQPIEQVNRSLEVKREFFLHNSEENVKIYFLDHTGLKQVETAYWTITKNAVILKESIVIPLAKIVAVA